MNFLIWSKYFNDQVHFNNNKQSAFIISMKDPDKFDVGLGYIKSVLKATNTEQPHHFDGKVSETPSSRNVRTFKCANRFL